MNKSNKTEPALKRHGDFFKVFRRTRLRRGAVTDKDIANKMAVLLAESGHGFKSKEPVVRKILQGRRVSPANSHAFHEAFRQLCIDQGLAADDLAFPEYPSDDPKERTLSAEQLAVIREARIDHTSPSVTAWRGLLWAGILPIAERIGCRNLRAVWTLVLEAGMPPGILLDGSGMNMTEYADHIMAKDAGLSESQKIVRTIADLVYPVISQGAEHVGRLDGEFDKARRGLSNWWKVKVSRDDVEDVFIVPHLCKPFDAENAGCEVFMLSWLEVALHRRTPPSSKGKRGLFLVGCEFMRIVRGGRFSTLWPD